MNAVIMFVSWELVDAPNASNASFARCRTQTSGSYIRPARVGMAVLTLIWPRALHAVSRTHGFALVANVISPSTSVAAPVRPASSAAAASR